MVKKFNSTIIDYDSLKWVIQNVDFQMVKNDICILMDYFKFVNKDIDKPIHGIHDIKIALKDLNSISINNGGSIICTNTDDSVQLRNSIVESMGEIINTRI